MGRAHHGVKTSNENKVVSKLLECPTEADYLETYKTFMTVNPTFLEMHFLQSKLMDVSGRLHGI